ncbi:MAG: hypothetical protein M8357_13865 [Desulfobulbaceae bacterium]|nr:hypothetical protein [Desulfobulbaceae bacterium]
MRRKNLHATCLLFLGTTLFFLFPAAGTSYSRAVVPAIDGHSSCAQCHDRFPGPPNAEKNGKTASPAKIPADKIDLLCMGCHGPAGITATRANIHGRQNYVARPIGCIECHDPHFNPPNYVDGQNIKLIGSNRSSVYATINTPNSGERFVVFESRGIDVGESSMYSFADGDEDNNGSFDGICEVCHTQTKYHRNKPKGDHGHYIGRTCTNCHLHVNQFLAFPDSVGGPPELSGSVVDDTGYAWAGITLFLDINGNGIWDQGEPIAVTDENGNFIFKGITNKGFDVLVMDGSLPDGYNVTITIDGNTVTVTTTAQPATVEGHVWSDLNRSGIFDDGDEGIPGVTVFADINGSEVRDDDEPAATTDDLGFYSLGELALGQHWIHIDESTLAEEYSLITNNVPLTAEFNPPGELLAQADFGYRSRFAFDPDNARLLYPTRLSWTPDGGYFVTDSKVDAMFIHDSTGSLTGQLRGLNKPLAVISDSEGKIYVGNNGRDNVEIYSAGGILLRVIDNGNLKMPNDLALDRKQNLYVLDSQNKMVKVYNPDGVFLRRIGNFGSGDGQFTFPIAMALNYRMDNEVEVGELFVADKKSSRIQVFDLAGNYLRSFGGPVEESSGGMMSWFGGGSTWVWEGRFVGIQSLAFDQHGRLHALDSFQDNVQILDPVTGAYIDHYNAFLEDTGAHLQLDIDISPEGRVIMTNVATRRVEQIYTVQ